MRNFLKNILNLAIICGISTVAGAVIDPKVIAKAKQASVVIKTNTSLTPYTNTGSKQGTGFINNIKQGIIVSNFHMTTYEGIGKYFVTFYTGEQAEAKLLFYSLWQDFAIFKVNPAKLPISATEIAFTDKLVKNGDTVFIVGNNEAYGFSCHDGHISDTNLITGLMPQQSYVMNLNSTGGSSGSPVLDKEGKAIALNYGGGQTSAIALKGRYVQDALDAINKSQIPNQRHIGVITSLYPMDDAVKHKAFPSHLMQEYIKKWPHARARAIIVERTLAGSSAAKHLRAGDIIWSANGKEIGASLYRLDNIMNNATRSVELEVYRLGKKIALSVPTYDIDKNKIKQLISFGGAIFFKANDMVSMITGIPLGQLAVVNIKAGSPFAGIRQQLQVGHDIQFRLIPLKINDYAINSMSDLITHIPTIVRSEYGTINFQNFQMSQASFGGTYITGNSYYMKDITFDRITETPRIYNFNNQSLEWEPRNIEVLQKP